MKKTKQKQQKQNKTKQKTNNKQTLNLAKGQLVHQ